ncbi:MAG: hypothetical protein A3H97_03285 [Acidobacteria bacterium RIFCSPLOWO2_02_FULL_65_29]|nr:MAG: hypothetical protein A3H97_03285 [Acidobacteria bacterium RIFCSPLOWO2_02_FULL_65_29]
MKGSSDAALPAVHEHARPPAWLIAATGLLALGTVALAIAETNLWMHYVIDAGESISLAGLAFMLLAGFYLFRRGRLLVSLPFAVPWLLFPIITQGDQIIDNLSINWMRLITHLLLSALFGAPVAVVVLAARYAVDPVRTVGTVGERLAGVRSNWLLAVPGLRQMASGRAREGSAVLAAILLSAEMWLAVRFLGELMVVTLIVMMCAVLAHGFTGSADTARFGHHRSERFALGLLIGGVVVSGGLYVGFKYRPGAYQGSPSYFMDPAQPNAGYQFGRVPVPSQPPTAPTNADGAREALTAYGRAFERLLAGYYILDRNYNYDFHNRLFLRSTPLLPDYRTVGLRTVHEAERFGAEANDRLAAAGPLPHVTDPLGALLEDVRAYAAFTFERARVLERMSATFEQTEAGLQHATHLYEGEGKVLGLGLAELLAKHHVVLSAPAVASTAAEFVAVSRAVHDAYANRIVGF